MEQVLTLELRQGGLGRLAGRLGCFSRSAVIFWEGARFRRPDVRMRVRCSHIAQSLSMRLAQARSQTSMSKPKG